MLIGQQESLENLTRKGACLAFFSAYSDLDTARMIGLATPDATVHFLPMGQDGHGTFWEFGKSVWDLLISCFPDLGNTINSLHTEDETVTAQVTIGGTQVKDFMDITNKGLSFSSDHVFVFRFDEHGHIEELTIDWNHSDFVRQLGS